MDKRLVVIPSYIFDAFRAFKLGEAAVKIYYSTNKMTEQFEAGHILSLRFN